MLHLSPAAARGAVRLAPCCMGPCPSSNINLFATINGHNSTAAGSRSSALPALLLFVQLVLINMLLPHLQVHVGWLPGGTAVFAFRGTDTAQDGLQDVKIMRRNIDYLQDLFPGVKAHVGGCCSSRPSECTCPA